MKNELYHSYKVITLKENVPRGHGVLLMCIDLFNTRYPPCYPELNKRERVVLNQKHRVITRDKLLHLVRFLTAQIVDDLREQHTWDSFQTADAEDLLDVFNSENVDIIMRMVYRKCPQKTRFTSNEFCVTEESRMAGVVAHLMDLVTLAKKYLQERTPVQHQKLLR